MIKRISPNSPQIPVKDIKSTVLNPVQVVNPNLSAADRAIYQQQLQSHASNYVAKALTKVYKEIEHNNKIAIMQDEREIEKIEAQLEDSRIATLLQQHGWGDNDKFRNKLKQILPQYADSISTNSASSITSPRPNLAKDPLGHIKQTKDVKDLGQYLSHPDSKVRATATQRYNELRSKK